MVEGPVDSKLEEGQIPRYLIENITYRETESDLYFRSSLLRIQKGLEVMRVDSTRLGVNGNAYINASERPEIGEPSETLPTIQPAESTRLDSTPGNRVHSIGTSISTTANSDITILQSISGLPWLSPTPVVAPSVGFREMLESLEEYQQLRLIKVLASNSQAACFEFYSGKAVYMGSSGANVFMLPNGRLPTAPHDFTLREWVTRMHTACYMRRIWAYKTSFFVPRPT